ncbi:MAG: Transcriptional regulatory protein PmpR [Verrucomicrobia bacterium ADurb.Bin345]|nr:MAG: Transcriptional regulatory protein PmpR [Verrucomicrobia bacterium ADurb.Bin345]
MRSFPRRGYILVAQSAAPEDRLMELILEAGAEDMKLEEGQYEILTDPAQFNAVVEALAKAGIKTESAELTLLPDSWAPVTDKDKASGLVRFTEELEELDDVQNVYSNADIAESVMKALEG